MKRAYFFAVVALILALFLVGCGNGGAAGGGTPDITVLFEGSEIAASSTQDLGASGSGDGTLSTLGIFSIRNDGDGTLTVTIPVSVSVVSGPGNIVASSQPLEAIDPGTTSDFLVQLRSAGGSGPVAISGSMTIQSNDPDESSFEVLLDGLVYY